MIQTSIFWICFHHIYNSISTCGSHYIDVIMSAMAFQITNLTNVYSSVYSGAYQRKHQSSPSLAYVRGIHRGPVNSPHKWPVRRKMFSFDDVIMSIKNVNFGLRMKNGGATISGLKIVANQCIALIPLTSTIFHNCQDDYGELSLYL